jgi:hypothetical protein
MSGPLRFPHLPADIIHTIVDELAVAFDSQNSDPWERHQNRLKRIFYSKELLDLRIVCREFCHIVSPRIFRTLRLTHTLPSIRGFIAMLQSPWVANCVQSVKYQYWNPGKPPRVDFILSSHCRASPQNLTDTKPPTLKFCRRGRRARRFASYWATPFHAFMSSRLYALSRSASATSRLSLTSST